MTRSLTLDRLRPAEAEIRQMLVTAPEGATIDDVLKPEFWAIAGRQLKVGDEITVRADDETFYAKVLVRQCGNTWAKVHLLHLTDLKPQDVKISGDTLPYTAEWAGGHTKFRIRRASDNAIVSQGHATKAEANTWITEHMKTLAA